MKILIISHKFYPDVGGIETVSEILATNFSKLGHDIRVVTWSQDPFEKKFPFSVIRKPNIITLFKAHAWAEIIFENNPSLRLGWPGIFIDRPLVISLHTWINQINGSVGNAEKLKFLWLKRAKKVISVSDAIRKRCWPSSVVIGNPYQEDIFKILPNVEKMHDFIFLGRLVSDKGADLAIHAFKRLLTSKYIESIPSNLTLTIVGDGPERPHLEQLVSELELQNNVFFKGTLTGDNLVHSLNQHRFLLVPSLWEEPFGIVVLEGMACGCLPIVSDGGGLPDAVGKAGLVFRRGDMDSFVAGMLQVLKNLQLEQHLRFEASSHLRSHTSMEVSKRYLAVIESALNVKLKAPENSISNNHKN